MTRTEGSITGFRRRLLQLIDQQFDGRYSRLARRAGLAVSSVQHHIHHARRLPGGDHLLRMAEALGVSVHFLVTGDETIRPAGGPPPLVPRVQPGGEPVAQRLIIPVFSCACPGVCPLGQPEPPMAAARSTVVLEHEMVSVRAGHQLIAVCVTPGCPSSEWPDGTRLVVEWSARPRQWEALTLIQIEGRCQWGHLTQVGDEFLFGSGPEGAFRFLPAAACKILGTAVAAIAPL